jgi:hypothetical protein
MLLAHRDLPNHVMLTCVRKSPPSEGPPQLLWATASVILMIDLRSRDPQAARDLLADMRTIANERGEPALWEEWAKAACNLMNDLPSRDLEAARDLLAEMRSIAGERGEPALWEQWAKAACNLMVDLRSRDPEAARAFQEDLIKLPEEDLKWLLLVVEQASRQASEP